MGLYRAILTLAAPVLLIAALLRILRGAESWGDLRQRLGRGPGGGDGTIWLHGASNGELTSARPLVEALRAAFPDRALVVTANTVTGRDLAAGWALPGVAARLAPFDFRPALRRFRAVWRPAALVVLGVPTMVGSLVIGVRWLDVELDDFRSTLFLSLAVVLGPAALADVLFATALIVGDVSIAYFACGFAVFFILVGGSLLVLFRMDGQDVAAVTLVNFIVHGLGVLAAANWLADPRPATDFF